MSIFTNILKFITDPKNTRMILLGIAVVFLLLFLYQCNRTGHFKNQVKIEKQETQRISNNYEAAMDTLEQYQVDEDTWRVKKSGYELTIEELEEEYTELLGDFKVEKNKPPKTLIITEYVIRDSIKEVPVFVQTDSFGNTNLVFNDSLYHDSINYRFLNGSIAYKVVFDPKDSLYKVEPNLGNFDLTIGMNLNLGLFQDKDTKKINIMADTNYPGVTFTRLDGASIMDDPENKKILRQMRKNWSIGLNIGYGALIDIKSGNISTGPYVGAGLTYSPKFLQWGK